MPRYKLRTLLILLAILPPLMWLGWLRYEAWREAERQRVERERMQQREYRVQFQTGKRLTVAMPAPPPPKATAKAGE